MPKALFQTAAVLALLSAGEAQAAQAKQCLTRAEVQGLVRYFLPTVLDTAIQTCSGQLPATGFLRTQGPRLVTELNAGRAAAWPMARQAFNKIGAEDGDDMSKMPDELVQPLFDEAIGGMLGQEIKAKDCKNIDRILAPLAPLPAQNMADFIGEVFIVAMRNDKEMPTCPDA